MSKDQTSRFSSFRTALLQKDDLEPLVKTISGLHTHSLEQKKETLIKRLWAYLPPERIEEFISKPEEIRTKTLCQEAVIELVRNHPYLNLAPAVTRSIFGYPSRGDRKKKRGSGHQIRQKAKERGFILNKTFLETFRVKMENLLLELPVHSEPPKEWNLFHLQLIQKIEIYLSFPRSSIDDYIPLIMQGHAFSDHSRESLDNISNLLKKVGLSPIPDASFTTITSPDLIAQNVNTNSTWFVELKEYHRGTRHSIHATAQVFKYLAENPRVILITTQDNFLIQEIMQCTKLKEINEIVTSHLRKLSNFLKTLDHAKNNVFKVYQSLAGELTVKDDVLLTCLFNDYFLHARGKLFAEIIAMKEIKKIIAELSITSRIKIVFLECPTIQEVENAINELEKDTTTHFLRLLVILEEDLSKWK